MKLVVDQLAVDQLAVDIYPENLKGANSVQRCSIENQKGAIAIDFVQQ